jgi:hypothetical protein
VTGWYWVFMIGYSCSVNMSPKKRAAPEPFSSRHLGSETLDSCLRSTLKKCLRFDDLPTWEWWFSITMLVHVSSPEGIPTWMDTQVRSCYI